MNYKGVIIEESLQDKAVLSKVKILKKDIEKVTERHKTPWVSQWTLDTIEVDELDSDIVAELLSRSLDIEHKSSWYVDFKNDKFHYIVYPGKIFKIKVGDSYRECRNWGISIGIPEYQLNFEDLKR